jgi:hypothetical protein
MHLAPAVHKLAYSLQEEGFRLVADVTWLAWLPAYMADGAFSY